MFKGIKRAIGAASPEEYYAQGMLELERGASPAAVGLFGQAAKKARDEGKAELASRAEAKAALHRFIDGGGAGELSALLRHLAGAGWVERPGDPSDRVPADQLMAEVEGRLAEVRLADAPSGELAAIHQEAAAAFGQCLDHRLVTYPHHHRGDEHVGTGRARHLYHTGMACVHTAKDLVGTDPDQAGRMLGRAIPAFAGCDDEEWQERCMSRLKRLQTRRTCWVCHREYPGEGDYYDAVSADVTPFIHQESARTGQDTSSIDVEGRRVVLCRVCESVIEARVKKRVSNLREQLMSAVEREVEQAVEQMRQQLQAPR